MLLRNNRLYTNFVSPSRVVYCVRFHHHTVQRMVCEVSLIVTNYVRGEFVYQFSILVCVLASKAAKHVATCCCMALPLLSRFVCPDFYWSYEFIWIW